MMRLALLVASAAAVRPQAPAEHVELHEQARRVVQYTSRVRFCNAYVPESDNGAVNLMLVRTGKDASNPEKTKINKEPIKFPSCVEDDRILLTSGDRFEIQSADKGEEMAEFVVEEFNESDDPLLMLVLARKSPQSREPHFVSHQYARLKNSQIAVMDLYLPEAQKHTMKIQRKVAAEDSKNVNVRYEEVLTPNSVMAFDPDMEYEIVLTDDSTNDTATHSFKAKAGEDYLALAVGMSESTSFSKPQLLFFPDSSVSYMLGFVALLVALVI